MKDHLFPDVSHVLAEFLWGLVSRIPYGDEGYRFQSRELGYGIVELIDVEVTHPACSQSLLRGSEAEMFYGYSQVNVSMRLVVVTACPALSFVLHTQNDGRDRVYPVAMICGLDQ